MGYGVLYSHRHAGDEGVLSLLRTDRCSRVHARYHKHARPPYRLPRVPESLLKKRKTADKIAAERAAKAIEDKKVRHVTSPTICPPASVRCIDHSINTEKKQLLLYPYRFVVVDVGVVVQAWGVLVRLERRGASHFRVFQYKFVTSLSRRHPPSTGQEDKPTRVFQACRVVREGVPTHRA